MLIEPGVAVFGGTAVATLREFADSSFFRGGEKSNYSSSYTDVILENYFDFTQDNPSSPSIYRQLSLVNLCQAWSCYVFIGYLLRQFETAVPDLLSL